MSTSNGYVVDFKEIIREINNPANHYTREELAIWGGTCAEADMRAFLQGWPLEKMPYRVWEYVSSIDLEKNTAKESMPENMVFLEQARLFGDGGDLSLRRDDVDFRWHFVGETAITPPDVEKITITSADAFQQNNFWDQPQHRDISLLRDEEVVLLWGERYDGQPHWFDDRVARAILDYPADSSWERVQLRYWTFSRAGQVEFVWLRDVEEWKEAHNG